MRNGTIKLKTIDENSFEFDESEMYPCDICGEFWPMDDMYELEDGSVICPDCMEEENGD